jgi:ABC-type phosphate transport system substrate-binding protein
MESFTNVKIDYQSIRSGGGIKQIRLKQLILALLIRQ